MENIGIVVYHFHSFLVLNSVPILHFFKTVGANANASVRLFSQTVGAIAPTAPRLTQPLLFQSEYPFFAFGFIRNLFLALTV